MEITRFKLKMPVIYSVGRSSSLNSLALGQYKNDGYFEF